MYNGNWVAIPLAQPQKSAQKRVRWAEEVRWQARRNRYASPRTRLPGRDAEMGTPQKQVRCASTAVAFQASAETGTVSGFGTQNRVRMACKAPGGRSASEPVSAWITGPWRCFSGEGRLKTPVNCVYPALARRNGYGLWGSRCGKGCGASELSPQKPVRATRRYRFGSPQIWVRPFAESSTLVRRIGFDGVAFSLRNQGPELHVYGLQVVNPYRYRLLVVDGWRTVDNPGGLPTVRHHATNREIPNWQKTGEQGKGFAYLFLRDNLCGFEYKGG